MDREISPDKISVCMPTWNSEPVLRRTLEHLGRSEAHSSTRIATLIIIDNESEDQTVQIARETSKEFGWEIDVVSEPCSLPEARERALERVETDWFIFLDDDAVVSQDYITRLCDSISPAVGAIQGRKHSLGEKNNSKWVQSRSKRGGTHATLIRKKAADGISFPPDLYILEDEYLRQYIESKGYLWIFNHQAIFKHETQNLRPHGWKHGYLGAKYGLSQFHFHLLYAPLAILNGRSPINVLKQLLGWLYAHFRFK